MTELEIINIVKTIIHDYAIWIWIAVILMSAR